MLNSKCNTMLSTILPITTTHYADIIIFRSYATCTTSVFTPHRCAMQRETGANLFHESVLLRH